MATKADGLGYAWTKLRIEAKRVYEPICHKCGIEIDMTAPPRTKWSWSLDHLLPRALHGPAVPDIKDVRPCHVSCNSKWLATGTGSLIQNSPRSREW